MKQPKVSKVKLQKVNKVSKINLEFENFEDENRKHQYLINYGDYKRY